MASWYGAQFQGRPTACGERFDKEQMTAAHRTLPFGTLVRVTNRDTGDTAVLRINDRGPFAKQRILDCSERAARELGFHVAGTARVRVEPLGLLACEDDSRLSRKERKRRDRELEAVREGAPAAPGLLVPVDADAGPFELQVGAFRDPSNAERLAGRLRDRGHEVRLMPAGEMTRVRVGPYATRRDAERAIAALDVEAMPLLLRRDP